ncbi:MAG: AMP-dependent synthetase/ligase [Actinomyces sp.]|uniref:AMP-dependent synthetase/ligase n=1 Tax=Actinomyces sp. TaxID=29317 RepID=UPI0026DD06AC|nr:AMP-dependent synthetase/ligase [Actinomyces sp.]MDO4243172.1 AMP-dependent synthetase/ligase [Actinomyces sp.]
MSTGTPSVAGSPAVVDGAAISPVIQEPDETWTIPWLLADRVARTPDSPIIERKSQLGQSWSSVSARAFGEEVARVAAGLVGMDLEPGASVSIMARTSYEWTLLDMAIARAGLVSVPIYETDSAEQVEWILEDSDVRLVITESAALAELVRSAVTVNASRRPDRTCVRVLSLDHDAIASISAAGQEVSRAELDARTNALTGEDLYTIIYTSGTTGRPKGVELSHRTVAGLAWNGVRWIPDLLNSPSTRLLLFLPLAHSYARFLQTLAIAGQGTLGHTPDVKTLLPDLQAFGPSYVLAVPRVLEKIYNAADAKAGSGARLKTFRWAAKVAIEYSRALDTPEGPSRRLRAARALADRLVFRTIRSLLGPNARYAISGGGPLGQRLGHFYRGLGLVILEGYGLTETIGPTSVNLDIRNKIGTVGPPVCGNQIRVGADGELEVRGLGVFTRYHNDPQGTAEAFTDDGWFRTGDIGDIDDEGWVRITGRKKDIIVTAGGKNVAPSILEDRLRGHPLVSQVLVIGDGEPFISALITLDVEMLPQWLKNHGLPEMDVSEAALHPDVLGALDRAVARTNRAVSRAESIRTYRVLPTDFTEANGLLTPSLKIKRAKVLERYADTVAQIYASTRKGPQE